MGDANGAGKENKMASIICPDCQNGRYLSKSVATMKYFCGLHPRAKLATITEAGVEDFDQNQDPTMTLISDALLQLGGNERLYIMAQNPSSDHRWTKTIGPEFKPAEMLAAIGDGGNASSEPKAVRTEVDSPGEMLMSDFYANCRNPARDMAMNSGLSIKQCQDIFDGSTQINDFISLKLGVATGKSASFWANIQDDYDRRVLGGTVADQPAESAPKGCIEAWGVYERQDVTLYSVNGSQHVNRINAAIQHAFEAGFMANRDQTAKLAVVADQMAVTLERSKLFVERGVEFPDRIDTDLADYNAVKGE